eukprot:4574787-Amphidinium_carterae.1
MDRDMQRPECMDAGHSYDLRPSWSAKLVSRDTVALACTNRILSMEYIKDSDAHHEDTRRS